MQWRQIIPKRSVLAAAFCLLLAVASSARAAVAYYVRIPEISGESTAPGRTDWIDATGFGAAVQGEMPRPNLPPVFIAKLVDKASPYLTKAVASGTAFPEVTMELVDLATGRKIYHLVLRNVLIASVQQSGKTSGAASENITLDYTQVEWTYTPTTGTQVITHFDKATATGGIGPFPAVSPTPTPVTDTDGDGIPDSYENSNGLDPSTNDAAGDLDGDGATNLEEYLAGTHANNPLSVFRVRGITLANGSTLITWSSVAGKTYHIFGSNLPEGPFTVVKQNIASAGDGETSTTVSASGAMLFYEVKTQ